MDIAYGWWAGQYRYRIIPESWKVPDPNIVCEWKGQKIPENQHTFCLQWQKRIVLTSIPSKESKSRPAQRHFLQKQITQMTNVSWTLWPRGALSQLSLWNFGLRCFRNHKNHLLMHVSENTPFVSNMTKYSWLFLPCNMINLGPLPSDMLML